MLREARGGNRRLFNRRFEERGRRAGSLGLAPAANMIEQAVQDVLQQGYRTFDISEQGCRIIGTREMGERIANRIRKVTSPVGEIAVDVVAN